MPSFDLTNQPWIPVLMRDGTGRELSLLETIESASDIASISGNPLESAVLHRLLLAIAHRVRTPKDPGEWLEIWRNRQDFLQEMSAYVRGQKDKFDLYDPLRPFLQHPGLTDVSRTPAEIVYDRSQGNNPIFLDGSVVASPQPITSSRAARAVLVTHAFGGSGTGGLNPLNGNKKDTMYAGPLCARMIAVFEGESLDETILFNLVRGKVPGQPSWERPLCDAPKQTRSQGPCDLYTRATRNLRLAPSEDGKFCNGVAVVMGEGISSEEGSHDDPMIPVYLAKDKKFKATRVDPGRALWRSSHALLIHETTDESRPLPAMDLISVLVVNRKLLEDRRAMRLRTLGVAANAQGPVTELWRDEALAFALSLFRDGNGYERLVSSIASAESEADTLRRQLYGFASRYVSDGGGVADPKDVARLIEEMSPSLNDFWMEIGPDGEKLALSLLDETEWKKRLVSARTTALNSAINRLAPDARRMRAQYVKSQGSTDSKNKKGRQTA
jgi:CRISPR system Cascade subunit CasA